MNYWYFAVVKLKESFLTGLCNQKVWQSSDKSQWWLKLAYIGS